MILSKLYIKKIIDNVTPPIILDKYRSRKQKIFSETGILFSRDDKLFKDIVTKAKIYGEYGVGDSTVWVINNSAAVVLSVDSDKQWIEKVKSRCTDLSRLDHVTVDLGKITNWGRPQDYSKRENFQKYTNSIWEREKKPDVVLVDGRFRVCCFLTSLLYAEEGTFIIFDDYKERPHYHIVEEFIKPHSHFGRQCIFVVPKKTKIEIDNINDCISKFRYVMD